MPKDPRSDIIEQLSTSIADDAGNMREEELEAIGTSFDKSLADALRTFNSRIFDDDGFIKKMGDLDLNGTGDRSMVRNVLNGMRTDYVSMNVFNESELLLRRDLNNICQQMPEMQDVVKVIRDSIIECNVATGEVSRSLLFENHTGTENLESVVKDIERRYDLLMAIKNFIVPNTLRTGEMYIHVVPYAKLFAEMEALHDKKFGKSKGRDSFISTGFRESCPNGLLTSFGEAITLDNESNIKALMESVEPSSAVAAADETRISMDERGNSTTSINKENITKESVTKLLQNIEVYNGASSLSTELGLDGFYEFVKMEYARSEANRRSIYTDKADSGTHFIEKMTNMGSLMDNSTFSGLDQDNIDISDYKHIKGCYVKYLDSLRVIPIRIDRRVIGYYYVTTTMDLQTNPANPQGTVDLSFQQYTRDRNMVNRLASMIINSFDKKMLERNIKLKNEIAEIIMTHKFSEGRLSFIYIPENEVIRMVINEDEQGKGHSVLEPTIFPARMYLLLNLYNMLYTLNNNTTRIHYLRSSGLNKDYAAQIQRTMRKFQSRRITVDDLYSYSGVLNKIGGIGEMVIPTGRSDVRALDNDVLEAVNTPINVEFLEQQRRQAISGTGVPSLMVINAIDEVDFAKTLELANTRFLSTVSSYKIDMNRGITRFYQKLLEWDSEMDAEDIRSFLFKFNAIKQQDLVITSEMLSNFDNIYTAVSSMYYGKKQLEDDDGPTPTALSLRRKLAMKYLPQLDFDDLDDIIREVDAETTDEKLQSRVNALKINTEDLKEVES